MVREDRRGAGGSVLAGWQAGRVDRTELLGRLAQHYKASGWSVKELSDGTLAAAGPGGVTWIGTAITATDLESESLGERLLELADRRMEGGGELCPLDVIAPEDCESRLSSTLERVGLASRRNVSIYSIAA